MSDDDHTNAVRELNGMKHRLAALQAFLVIKQDPEEHYEDVLARLHKAELQVAEALAYLTVAPTEQNGTMQ